MDSGKKLPPSVIFLKSTRILYNSPMPVLDWIGKDAVANSERRAPYHIVHCDNNLSAGNADAANLLIHGDNLLALKALLPYYREKVKCVYIDPPFNTGNESWVYNDRVNSPTISKWLEKTVGGATTDLTRHDKWLCMMQPRLALLHDFLRPDGAIFVSIDDNASHYLRVLLDDIFGEENFIRMITNTTAAPSGLKAAASQIFGTANYVFAYGKNRKKFKPRKLFIERSYDSAYSKFLENPSASPRQWKWIGVGEKTAKHLGYPSAQEAKRALGDDFAEKVAQFAVAHAEQIFRIAAFGGGANGNRRATTIEKSLQQPGVVFVHPGDEMNYYILNGGQMIFYDKSVIVVDGMRVPGQMLTDVWTDIAWTGIANEGGVTLKNGKKPERLIERVLHLATKPGDLVLDSFLGSGTTAAVAHKMGRRWIGIEMENHAKTLCAKRLRAVVDGTDKSGISESVKWKGGEGFRFCKLGAPLFDESGGIARQVKFSDLAAHVFFSETGTPIPKRANRKSPLLGEISGKAVYLLFNGVLGDRSRTGGNVLNTLTLPQLPKPRKRGSVRVVYGESCDFSDSRMKRENIIFRQIPTEVKDR